MSHFVLLVLHLVALVAMPPALFVTLPAHAILVALQRGRRQAGADAPSPATHVRRPDCRELVRMDATRCRHCGVALVPQAPGQGAQ